MRIEWLLYCLYKQPCCYPAQLQRSFCPFFVHSHIWPPVWIPLVSLIVCSSTCTITDSTSAILSLSQKKFSEDLKLCHFVTLPPFVSFLPPFCGPEIIFCWDGRFSGFGFGSKQQKQRGSPRFFCKEWYIYIYTLYVYIYCMYIYT